MGGCKGCCTLAMIGKILLIIGGINWGLVGVGMLMGNDLDAWNVVHMLLKSWPVVEGIVYVLVGVAGQDQGVLHPLVQVEGRELAHSVTPGNSRRRSSSRVGEPLSRNSAPTSRANASATSGIPGSTASRRPSSRASPPRSGSGRSRR